MTTAVIDAVRVEEAVDPVRAWVDVDYRFSLDDRQRAEVPESPIGELTAVTVPDIVAGESTWISILGGAATCLTTLACTRPCCAW